MKNKKDKIVFLDRDGTINVEKNYLYRTDDFLFIHGVPEAIHLLKENGYKVIVVTNQAGIARGYYSEEDVLHLHAYINQRLAESDTSIDAFYYCPHHPTAGIGKYKTVCTCRKPSTGMFQKACEAFDIDLEQSWMIGDNCGDIEAGMNFGLKTILVETGYGKELLKNGFDKQSYHAVDLLEAVMLLLKVSEENEQSTRSL